MKTVKKSGKPHESDPEIAEFDEATESSLTLYAIRDALTHMNYACRLVVHTECNSVAAAINQHWPQAWQENSWRNSKEKEVKNADLWSMILEDLEEMGHTLEAEKEKHEWSDWMRWNLPLKHALKGIFTKVPKEQ